MTIAALHTHDFRCRPIQILGLTLAGLLAVQGAHVRADSKDAAPAKKQASPLPMGVIPAEAWKAASTKPLQAGEIDRLVAAELKKASVSAAPLVSDEQFVRRVTLDLTGRLPAPADVTEFLADRNANKRAKLIDLLLETDDYAKHWARYWRDVIASRTTDFRGRLLARNFDAWMTEEVKKNTNWADLARAMITATGEVHYAQPDENGSAYLLLSRVGADANNERAAEVSRLFLGIQIQCAQCHDHPFDDWKRAQFHEFAAYFARLKERPIRDGMKLAGLTLFAVQFGEHQMPSKEDPKKGTLTNPRFLTGETPGNRLPDAARRKALADSVVSSQWFAAAYVNRVWGELMGQSFYLPVDDMGPQKEAVFPSVLPRLAGSFRGSNYDMKAMLRAMMNSQTYQRQIRPASSADEHLLFAALYPSRLNAEALYQSLTSVLGNLTSGRGFVPKGPAGPFAFNQGFEGLFQQEFGFDPSAKQADVEGSVPQALLLMNSPILNGKIEAKGNNVLARILKSYPQNDEALRMLYLRTLARRPTDRELSRCLSYIQRVGNRTEAFEDVMWSLLNSTEFQTKR